MLWDVWEKTLVYCIAITQPFYPLGISLTTVENNSSAETDLISKNQLDDYSFIKSPFTLDEHYVLLRCATGLGAGSESSINLGGWYFNGKQISVGTTCQMQSTFQVRQASNKLYPGVINLYPCRRELLLNEEGFYSCTIRNSSMIYQTMRVGLYLSGRSELHDDE